MLEMAGPYLSTSLAVGFPVDAVVAGSDVVPTGPAEPAGPAGPAGLGFPRPRPRPRPRPLPPSHSGLASAMTGSQCLYSEVPFHVIPSHTDIAILFRAFPAIPSTFLPLKRVARRIATAMGDGMLAGMLGEDAYAATAGVLVRGPTASCRQSASPGNACNLQPHSAK